MKSLGFEILYFSHHDVVEAFSRVGVNARFDETTPEDEVLEKVRAWEHLSPQQQLDVAHSLLEIGADKISEFISALAASVSRQIESISVIPLHGAMRHLGSARDAITFIEEYAEGTTSAPFSRYEIQIRYNNGSRVDGQFLDKETAVEFLRDYLPPLPEPVYSEEIAD